VKVLIVSGIWPPDVGGPASHAPDVAAFLRDRGHDVEVVTTADAPPPARPYPVRAVPRHHRVGMRHYRGAALVRRRARRGEVSRVLHPRRPGLQSPLHHEAGWDRSGYR